MGDYNPHAPFIIGEEWVPIRQANYTPDDGVTERGYRFRIDHATTIVSGAYYVAAPPAQPASGAVEFISVYPAGTEDLTGPIKSLVIPASAVAVTGTGITVSVSDLQNPSDGNFAIFDGGPGNTGAMGISFDVTSYSQQLFGKRILDVKLLYTASANNPNALAAITVWLRRLVGGNSLGFQTGLEGASATDPQNTVNSVSFTDINPFWTSATDGSTQQIVYPWRYQELANFAVGGTPADRMIVYIVPSLFSLTTSDDALMGYAALEVTYCEEQRILYGGDRLNFGTGGNYYPATPAGKLVMLRTPQLAIPTSIAAGEYTVVENHRNITTTSTVVSPTLYALRELYPLPAQHALQINRSTEIEGEFTVDHDVTDLTHLTLHTAAAIVTGVHAYGTQNDVPVYGTITATQEIEDDPVGSTARSFPYVRFYARRFGNTSVPLQLVDVATGLSTVSVSVEDFDALTEIVDGWREVNLTFTTAPSFSTAAGDVDWRWQSISTVAGSQWQVLGMGGPALSGAHATGVATYYAPRGDTVTLTWQSPPVSGAADDTLSDAVLIFSQDPPAVTGFAVTQASQALDVAADDCGLPQGCIPSALQYNQLSWPYPRFSAYAFDSFTRVATNGWGNTEVGGTWTDGGNPTNFAVNGTYAVISPNGTSARIITTPLNVNFDITADLGVVSAVVATSTAHVGIIGRFTDASNYYYADLQTAPTTGVVTLVLVSRVAGSNTTLATRTLPTDLTNNAGAWLRVRFMGQDDRLKVKVWHTNEDEPDAWELEVTSTTLTSGSSAGIFAQSETVATNVLKIDNFEATPPRFWFGHYEIQRRDDLTDWETIMLATSPAVTGFADYEARVGIESEYRIRQCNVLDFCGSTWVTGAGTIPTPGVTTTGNGNSTLIFTSNEDSSGNLAYVMQWEGQPIEAFAFPEASEVTLQRMYGKDFFTAFHPLERGGEQFTRTLLVNAAAIAAPSLGNFRELRDLGWAELNYVCVRDELGNRWYANVRVPEGNVRLDRTIYLAQIQVTEVTDTPTPVDPEVT